MSPDKMELVREKWRKKINESQVSNTYINYSTVGHKTVVDQSASPTRLSALRQPPSRVSSRASDKNIDKMTQKNLKRIAKTLQGAQSNSPERIFQGHSLG